MATIVFGGKNLVEGQHTWYEGTKKKPGAESGPIIQVNPGDEVDESEVKNAKGYIQRGQATRKEAPRETSTKKPTT